MASLTAVSAFYHSYNYNGDDAMIDSFVSLSYSGQIKSDEYAYYYQGSGTYAEDAYWWSR